MLVLFINRKKKRIDQELLPSGTITIKPGGLTTPVLTVGNLPTTLEVPQLPGGTGTTGISQPSTTPIPVPMLAKSTQIQQPTIAQSKQTPTIQQFPQLPPVRIEEIKPTTTHVTPIPTPKLATSIQSQISSISPVDHDITKSPVGLTPTVTKTPVIKEQQGPNIHLPDSPIPDKAPVPTQPKPVIAENNIPAPTSTIPTLKSQITQTQSTNQTQQQKKPSREEETDEKNNDQENQYGPREN